MPAYSKQIKGSLTEAQYQTLMEYCKKNEKTISEVVREALRAYFANKAE